MLAAVPFFYRPDHPDYMRAKRIRKGAERVDPVFDAFVGEFTAYFGFAPLSLDVDVVVRPGGNGTMRPRLGVVLERSVQFRSFKTGTSGNYDSAKQRAITEMLVERVTEANLRRLFSGPGAAVGTIPLIDDLFVYFTDFEDAARSEAHERVMGAVLDAFIGELALGDEFWCTLRYEGAPVVFVRTEEQAEALRVPAVQDRWAEAYFALVHRQDEFGYLRREDISIAVDSKENFDMNYNGSWFYYFR
jgi:hypothetical protein